MEKVSMTNVTSKLVTPARLRQLLDCYGSSSASWPEDERQAALSLLKGSPELRVYREQNQPLDKLLKEIQVQETNTSDQAVLQSLQQRIISQLPEQKLDIESSVNTKESRDPQCARTQQTHRSRIWMGGIAAGLFIVSLSVGIIQKTFNPEHNPVPQQTADMSGNDFVQWAWEDITDESLTLDADNEPTTLLALVELELPTE
jgi:hypothetical protein